MQRSQSGRRGACHMEPLGTLGRALRQRGAASSAWKTPSGPGDRRREGCSRFPPCFGEGGAVCAYLSSEFLSKRLNHGLA